MKNLINLLEPARVIGFSAFLLFLIIPILVAFLWNVDLDVNTSIDHQKFGVFGDFVGGILGSLWSFCGVLLLYMALVDQRSDFDLNRKAFANQIEALQLQANEFKLQRDELIEARKVSIEQARTLKQQRLESTYFSLLELYHKVKNSLNDYCTSKNYFKELRLELIRHYNEDSAKYLPAERQKRAIDNYVTCYYSRKEELTHYFKLLYRIVKIIDETDIISSEKFKYVKILRSQISENEMLALYYNSLSPYGEDFYRLILKYNLLKHLPAISKIELLHQLPESEHQQELQRFSNSIQRNMLDFTRARDANLRSESYSPTSIEYLLFPGYPSFIKISADDYNTLELSFSIDELTAAEVVGFSQVNLAAYLEAFCWDMFFFSGYVEVSDGDNVIVNWVSDSNLVIKINSNRKLDFCTDSE